MKFKYQDKECDVEVFSNEDGIVVKFYSATIEPKEDRILDYVYVDAGYGYIHLKRKGEDGIMSALLKKEFFNNSSIVDYTIDFVERLLPNMDDAYIPYNLERVITYDSMIYTGETYDGLKDEQTKTDH
jgi:hypothetical protein